jgi:hypothetical protein
MPIASGIFVFAMYVGGATSSLTTILVEFLGWRFTCYVIAGCGLILTALVLYTLENPPPRKKPKFLSKLLEEDDTPTFWDTYHEIKANKVILVLFIAGSFRFVAEYAYSSFLPTYYMLYFENEIYSYSIINALIILFGGILSSTIRIYISSQIEYYFLPRSNSSSSNGNILINNMTSVSHYQMLVLIFGAVFGIIGIIISLNTTNLYTSLFGLFIYQLTTESWYVTFCKLYVNELSLHTKTLGRYLLSNFAILFGSTCAILIGRYMHHDATKFGMVIPDVNNVRIVLSHMIVWSLMVYITGLLVRNIQ